jgi:hypothetical protein
MAGALLVMTPVAAAEPEVAVACPATVPNPSSPSARPAAIDYWTIFDGAPEDGVSLAPDDERRLRWDFTGMNSDALRLRCFYAGTPETRTLALPKGTQRCEARGKLNARKLNGPMVLYCATR